MALVQRATPKRLTNLFRFPKRSLRSLRFPGESVDCSSSPALAYGIHVFHCPVSHPCFGFWLSCLFMVLEFKMGVLEWMCRMQLGLWPSYPSPLLPEEVTYSVPMCLCRKTSTSSIPEGTLLLKNWGFICNFINGVCYVWWKEVFCGESRHFLFVCWKCDVVYWWSWNCECVLLGSEFIFDPVKWTRSQMNEDFSKLSQIYAAHRSVVRVPDQDPKYKIGVLASKQVCIACFLILLCTHLILICSQ